MKSKCCCCIPNRFASVVLAISGLLLSLLELAVLLPYIFQVEEFNPIQEHLNDFYYILESMAEENEFTTDYKSQITEFLKEWNYTIFITEIGLTSFYALCTFLLILGVSCKKRWLMIPYLIYQMLIIIVFMAICVVVTVFLFFINLIIGFVCTAVALVASVFFVYFWIVVKNTYVELNSRTNYVMYEPAPLKPPNDYENNHYNNGPRQPQQFVME